MLASLSDMFNASMAGRKSKPRRAPTATSELDDSSDDVSETESAESSQSGAPYLNLRRQQSCPSGPRKARLDTQPESEGDAETGLKAVYSFARNTSSKLFLVKPKPHSRSVDIVSDVDAKTAGARVATRFGLGRIVAVRAEDGVAAIELQASGLLFLNAREMDEVQVVPALVGERVAHPVRIGAGAELRPSDVRVDDSSKIGRTFEPQRRPRGLSEGSAADWDSRRTRSRLSSASAAPAGLTLLKSIATTSYTFVASKYHQGQPVITKFGAGHILSVDPQRGGAQIQLLWGAVAYLNADMIDFYPKALEGTDVQTKFGPGVVIGLRPADAIYTVRLHDVQPTGKSDVVFVHESDLHRSRRIAVTAANVRDRLKAMAQRRFGERIVVAHQHHDEEPNSAGI
ncbi:uncharacterized protein KRP23_2556 [Phytophthora ramorum]|uniref:uncharacterized protein n=1 Tax=Phytophthora ramorum TaxID=164328 RepID=UPI0030B15D0B|nr:hypothetical protein KRP23_2556 [Phytophthora ramorum]